MIILVDFENTHASGLEGYEYLNETDTVVMYYSDENSAITRGMVDDLKANHVNVRMVKLLKQHSNALDMYIASTTGMFLDSGEKICIVSKDKGYAAVRDFWHSLRNAEILLGETIEECFLHSVANDEERIRNAKERQQKALLTDSFETMNKIPTRPTLSRYGSRRRKNILDTTKNLDPVEILPNPLWRPNPQEAEPEEEVESGVEEAAEGAEDLGFTRNSSEPLGVAPSPREESPAVSPRSSRSGGSSDRRQGQLETGFGQSAKTGRLSQQASGVDGTAETEAQKEAARDRDQGSKPRQNGRGRRRRQEEDREDSAVEAQSGRVETEAQEEAAGSGYASPQPAPEADRGEGKAPIRQRSRELFSNINVSSAASDGDVDRVHRVIPRVNPNQVQYIYDPATGQMKKVEMEVAGVPAAEKVSLAPQESAAPGADTGMQDLREERGEQGDRDIPEEAQEDRDGQEVWDTQDARIPADSVDSVDFTSSASFARFLGEAEEEDLGLAQNPEREEAVPTQPEEEGVSVVPEESRERAEAAAEGGQRSSYASVLDSPIQEKAWREFMELAGSEASEAGDVEDPAESGEADPQIGLFQDLAVALSLPDAAPVSEYADTYIDKNADIDRDTDVDMDTDDQGTGSGVSEGREEAGSDIGGDPWAPVEGDGDQGMPVEADREMDADAGREAEVLSFGVVKASLRDSAVPADFIGEDPVDTLGGSAAPALDDPVSSAEISSPGDAKPERKKRAPRKRGRKPSQMAQGEGNGENLPMLYPNGNGEGQMSLEGLGVPAEGGEESVVSQEPKDSPTMDDQDIAALIEQYGSTSNTLHQYYLKIMKAYGKAEGKPIYDASKKAMQAEIKRRKAAEGAQSINMVSD